MGYYITISGKVQRADKRKEAAYDTESFGLENYFVDKYVAYAIRDIIEDNKPIAFLCLKN